MRQSRWVVLSILVAVLAAGAGYLVRAAGGSDAPPGVSVDQWMPISDSLGIVLDDPVAARAMAHRIGKSGQPDPRLMLISTPGHLLAKVDGVWMTIDVHAPIGRVLPAN